MSFFNLPPEQFTLLAYLVGALLAQNLDSDEQNSLGNFVEAVGQAILTIAAQEQLQQSQNNNAQMCEEVALIKKQIELLERKLKR
ncbi:hypothetical protein [Marinisporobacter balticus]|uniref:Uncharacterized protein n=1 Tax=Marinisporobacter balticus TaxID=2018667 RepID=A0A4R2L2R7_9FIRM|nr:hypothetical protein [Marinisporobacter balticus]TCO76858.1 hypothetical protein EV214_10714 [Marinisporobacter balticus]